MEIVLGELADWLARVFRKRPLLRFFMVVAVIGLSIALLYIEWFG